MPKLLNIIFVLFFVQGCAYYNILFNAEESYKNATKRLDENKKQELTSDVTKDYNACIDKCWKLINLYSDSNSYADDALLLISKSHYQLKEYLKAERFFRQFTQRYTASDLLSEAKLWLARSLIELERGDEALVFLEEILAEEISSDISAFALFSVGELYLIREENESALESFTRCVEVADDEQLAAKAQNRIGDIHLLQQSYIKAIESFTNIRNFEAPVALEYRATLKKVDAQLALERYEAAIKTLRIMSGESRFLDVLPVIEARVGDCYNLQGLTEDAALQYQFVLEKYPKTEGASNAAYGLAGITETFYADPDSASSLYKRVKTEFRRAERGDEAVKRAQILESYVKFKTDIEELRKELKTSFAGDSIETDTLANIGDPDSTGAADTDKKKSGKNVKAKKRDVAEINNMIENKLFSLAEFFLLTMQNSDSAQAAYNNFISISDDSLLIPKAYYALYFISKFQKKDSVQAESFRTTIINNYPESPYATYFYNIGKSAEEEEAKIDPYKLIYSVAENHLSAGNYIQAIDLFRRIVVEDSGSVLAGQARYAIAWTYETKLNDIDNAVDAYSAIVKEYPGSSFAKIAQKKIQAPPPEKEEDKTTESVEEEGQVRPEVKPDDETEKKKSGKFIEIDKKEDLQPEKSENPDKKDDEN